MTDNPFAAPTSAQRAATGPVSVPNELWAYLPGLLLMLGGALYTMTCFGAPFGVPLGFVGIALWRAGDGVAALRRDGTPEAAAQSVAQLIRALRIYGIMTAVILAIEVVVLGMIAVLAVIGGNLD